MIYACALLQQLLSDPPPNPDLGYFPLFLILLVVAFLVGVWIGLSIMREANFLSYRAHIDKHFFSTAGDAGCLFCREERGIRGAA